MSAFMVGTDHINAMVDLAIRGPVGGEYNPGTAWSKLSWYVGDPATFTTFEAMNAAHRTADYDTADAVGRMLQDANAASMAARYELFNRADESEPFTYSPHPRRPTAVEGLKIVRCFEYQASEYDGWKQSEAYTVCEHLTARLISLLPDYDRADGWDWHY